MKNGKFEKKDLDELNEFYKNNGPMTCVDFRAMVDEVIEWNEGDSEEDQEAVEFWSAVQESTSGGEIYLYDVKDEDAFSVITDIMETLHYDNGKPLVCDESDYLDQYDREKKKKKKKKKEDIEQFELDKDGNLILVMVMNKEELTDKLTDMYDGSSWDHDFGK